MKTKKFYFAYVAGHNHLVMEGTFVFKSEKALAAFLEDSALDAKCPKVRGVCVRAPNMDMAVEILKCHAASYGAVTEVQRHYTVK